VFGTFIRENHPVLLGIPLVSLLTYGYAAITLYGSAFQEYSPSLERLQEVHTPHLHKIISYGFGLTYSAFARRYSRNHYCFLFLQVLKCFTSLGSPSLTLGYGNRVDYWATRGCPIRESRGQRLHAANPSLSQLATPFFGAQAEIFTKQRRRIGV